MSKWPRPWPWHRCRYNQLWYLHVTTEDPEEDLLIAAHSIANRLARPTSPRMVIVTSCPFAKKLRKKEGAFRIGYAGDMLLMYYKGPQALRIIDRKALLIEHFM